MPPIKSINLSDGIKIVGNGIPSVEYKLAQFPSIGNLLDRQTQVKGLVQSAYEYSEPLNSLTKDEPPTFDPPILTPRQRIEKIGNKDYLITKRMFVDFHIFSLVPLKYTIRCSDEPIEGEWWL